MLLCIVAVHATSLVLVGQIDLNKVLPYFVETMKSLVAVVVRS